MLSPRCASLITPFAPVVRRQLDALGELALEINEFADLLQSQRLGELEAAPCCAVSFLPWTRRSLPLIPTHRLRLINPAAERIFHLIAERDLGCERP